MSRPNILYIMTDQQRFDTIRALGNPDIYTPNMDRLVRRGLAFSNAYSTCPVCVAARYTIRTASSGTSWIDSGALWPLSRPVDARPWLPNFWDRQIPHQSLG